MKLKYYLRGLGVGIICTAIIMGIALSGQKVEKLTDAEIIERARLLGMVMTEESDSEKEDEDSQKKDSQKEDNQKEESQTEENQKAENQQQDDQKQEPADIPQEGENQEQEPQEPLGEAEIKTIEIVSGDYSDVVSQKLFEAGLISDAAVFNSYLTESGADREITVGVHKIPVGTNQDEIIKILKEKPE